MLPAAGRIEKRIALGMPVLAEQMHLVAELGESADEARVIYVPAGPLEQVAMKDEDAHRRGA